MTPSDHTARPLPDRTAAEQREPEGTPSAPTGDVIAFRTARALGEPEPADHVSRGLVTWVTFVPSFLFIFLGSPYIERRNNRALAGALTGITAAVVGVTANLAVYFAASTLFARTITIDDGPLALHLPDLATLRPVTLAIAVIGALLLFAARWTVLRVLGVCAVLGLVAGVAGLPIA